MNSPIGTVVHGSHLYGLAGPQSDRDLKSIHLPSLRDCVLLRAAKNTQNKEGIQEGSDKAQVTEYESFALQEFLKLAANGEDIAITMLHAKGENVVVESEIFSYLRTHRKSFYTKRMRGALGFAKSQSAKYALRADRMAAVERVISLLEIAQSAGVARLSQCWDDLTEGEYVTKTLSPNDRGEDKRVLDVAGKMLPATITPIYALDILCRLRDNYGDRVKAAKNLDGKDMKSISHSLRVGYQLLHIYQDGDFTFPLPESDFIRDVKYGRLSYIEDRLDEKLNELITTVEKLAGQSSYPEQVDQKWLDEIVLKVYEDGYGLLI